MTSEEYKELLVKRESALRRVEEQSTVVLEIQSQERKLQAQWITIKAGPFNGGTRFTDGKPDTVEMARLEREFNLASAQAKEELLRLDELKRLVPVPDWPERFEPVDPLAPSDPTAATTQPAEVEK